VTSRTREILAATVLLTICGITAACGGTSPTSPASSPTGATGGSSSTQAGGSSTTQSSTTPTTVAAAETAASFVAELAAAIRTGNAAFLFSRLNPAVLARFGATTCHTFAASVHDRTARFVVVSVGRSAPYTYTTSGRSTVVQNVVPVTISATRDAHTVRTTIHVAAAGDPVKYSWFTDCGAKPASAGAARFAGRYSGTWNNLTFGSTGSIALTLTIGGNGGVGSPVRVDTSLGGTVFGGTAPPTQTFTGSVETAGLVFSGTSAFFGQLTWHVAANGTLTATGTHLPGGRVSSFSATGTFTASSVSLNYQVALVGGMTAHGTIRAMRG
jgi:hypothetical protein